MHFFRNILYFIERKILPGFRVHPDSLVVDIGSGDKPFWRADVCVDSLSKKNEHRYTNRDIDRSVGIFVDADIHSLPFADKSFDFSFCSHVLEHTEDPAAVIQELIRVSKSGYIEVPNGIIETIMPFVSHLWFIYQKQNTLVFVRKSQSLHMILSKNGVKHFHDSANIRDPFIRIYWKNTVPFEIIQISKKERYVVPKKIELRDSNDTPDIYGMFIRLLRLLWYKKKDVRIVSR